MDVNDKFGCTYKRSMLENEQERKHDTREDEATDGDGVVTMKAYLRKKWSNLHVKGHMDVRPGKACIPPVTHR